MYMCLYACIYICMLICYRSFYGPEVYGPETHITAIIPMALGLVEPLLEPDLSAPAGPPVRKMIDLSGKKPVGKGHPPAPAGGWRSRPRSDIEDIWVHMQSMYYIRIYGIQIYII